MITYVWVTSEFEGYHRWKDAPDDVAFLRDFHRHIFKVKLLIEVTHNNRDVEFFQLKRKLKRELLIWNNQKFEDSCEMIAAQLLRAFNAAQVEVSEDGENGAIVCVCSPIKQEDRQTSIKLPSIHRDFKITNDQVEQAKPKPKPQQKEKLPDLLRVKKTKCFIGVEAEGPNRGQLVLFVPGSVTPTDFLVAWDKVSDRIAGVYYGAGNDRYPREDTLRLIIRTCTVAKKRLDVELLDCSQWPKTVPLPQAPQQVFLISWEPSDFGKCHFIKKYLPSTEQICWTHSSDPQDKREYRTSIHDPLFSQDQDLLDD
jgi:hypothetical protein